MTRRGFAGAVGVVTVVGLVPRVLVARHLAPHGLVGDSAWYDGVARAVSRGDGFVEPLVLAVTHQHVPTATHPPLYALYLAAFHAVGIHGSTALRIASAVAGVLVVPLVAVFVRRLVGERAALAAALVAALYPIFWFNDGGLLSESLLAPLTGAMLVAALAAHRTPDRRRAALLGVAVAAMVLTRSETVLLVPLLVVPLLARSRAWRALAVALGATAIAVAPWAICNVTRFDEPVVLSGNFGGTLAGSSCDQVWQGARIGWWGCPSNVDAIDEGVRDRKLRKVAIDYWRAHERRAPVVVAARVGRLAALWKPRQTADLDAFERGAPGAAGPMLAGYAVAALLGVVGLVALHRAHRFVLWWWALLSTAVLTAAVFYGSWRFRVPADVALCALAGVGVDTIVTRLLRGGGRRPDDPSLAAPAAR